MIFSLEILKNYIVRCDFWSCRHFAGRLVYMFFGTGSPNIGSPFSSYSNTFALA